MMEEDKSPEDPKAEKPLEGPKAERPKRKAKKEPVQKDSFGQAGSAKSESQDIEKETHSDPPIEGPHSDLNKSEIENPKSEINMEVHHHPDVEKKGFKEYLLEGLMIFLAVTMGFFAETIRENISESSRAKELAASLYKEVYADSVVMQAKLKLRLQKEEQMNYFRQYVADSSLTNLSPRFYPAFEWSYVLTSSHLFEPNDGILSQLRNSGSLRYLKGTGVQNRISQLDVVIAAVRNRNDQEREFVNAYARPFMLKHFDFKWQDEYLHDGQMTVLEAFLQTNFHPFSPPFIKHLDQFDRQDAEGLTAYYLQITRATKQLFYQHYIDANRQLLAALRKEYHFKNE